MTVVTWVGGHGVVRCCCSPPLRRRKRQQVISTIKSSVKRSGESFRINMEGKKTVVLLLLSMQAEEAGDKGSATLHSYIS